MWTLRSFVVRIVATAVVVCLAAPSRSAVAAPQLPTPSSQDRTPDLTRLEAWLRAVDGHQPGVWDSHAQTLERTDAAVLGIVLADLVAVLKLESDLHTRAEKTGQVATAVRRDRTITSTQLDALFGITRDRPRDSRVNEILKRGALLETDVAFLAPPQELHQLGSEGAGASTVLVVRDGELTGTNDLASHLQFARLLLDMVTPRPSTDDMVRRWYRATVALLEAQQMMGDTTPHIARALALFPGDAVLQFDAGAMHECLAGPEVQSAIVMARAMQYNVKVGTAQAELRLAEQAYRVAVDIEPSYAEAHLHLGRVAAELGEHAIAVSELTRAGALVKDPPLQYYAALFLGSEQEATGQRTAARASFERALTLFPHAQAAHIALSRHLRAQGDVPGAMSQLERLLAMRADDLARADPWWMYLISHTRTAPELIAAVREPFRHGVER